MAAPARTTELRLWSRVVTGHQLFGTRFSEGLDTVKDLTENELGHDCHEILHSTEKSVEKDMKKDFKSYGHHMWDLK